MTQYNNIIKLYIDVTLFNYKEEFYINKINFRLSRIPYFLSFQKYSCIGCIRIIYYSRQPEAVSESKQGTHLLSWFIKAFI